jgi:hypothetical protein
MDLSDEMEKCTFRGCENRGMPQDSYDFFVCDACFDELERHLERAAQKRYERHANN